MRADEKTQTRVHKDFLKHPKEKAQKPSSLCSVTTKRLSCKLFEAKISPLQCREEESATNASGSYIIENTPRVKKGNRSEVCLKVGYRAWRELVEKIQAIRVNRKSRVTCMEYYFLWRVTPWRVTNTNSTFHFLSSFLAYLAFVNWLSFSILFMKIIHSKSLTCIDHGTPSNTNTQ